MFCVPAALQMIVCPRDGVLVVHPADAQAPGDHTNSARVVIDALATTSERRLVLASLRAISPVWADRRRWTTTSTWVH